MRQILHSFLLIILFSLGMKAQTTLSAGDVAFTGYYSSNSGSVPDTISFVLLKNISSGTQISFSDRGYFSGGTWQTAGSAEGSVTWTSGSALAAGSEVIIAGLNAGVYIPSSNTLVSNGSVALSEGTMTAGLALTSNGDQIFAFQGGSGSISGSGVTLLAGLHYYYCNTGATSDASWDSGCSNTNLSSALPPTLTGGTNAFYTGTIAGSSVPSNGKFNCTGVPSSIAGIRTAVMNPANWTLSTTTDALPLPAKCNFLTELPVILTDPASQTICSGDKSIFTVVASGASNYQWQQSTNGTTYSNLSNINPYSGVTTATLTITGTTANLNGYKFRCVASNLGGDDTSAAAVLTVSTITATTSATHPGCHGAATGSASVTAGNGTAPYTYNWAPTGGTESTASGLTAGLYTVTVTDANNCSASKTVALTQPEAIVVNGTQTNILCFGGTNGSITVTSISGGSTPYSYNWAPLGSTASKVSNLSAGNYTLTVTDASSCSVVKVYSISQPADLVAVSTQTNVACNGGNTGSAAVTITGGTLPYTYAWTPSGGNSSKASNLSPGTYTVTVKDANSCSISQDFTITHPTALSAVATQTNVACNGATTGIAVVDVIGGTIPYTYNWTPTGGTASVASNLAAGNYTVTVKDANNCSVTKAYTISQPANALSATTSQVNIACYGGNTGSITASVIGGTTPYIYDWTPTGGTASKASNLTSGTYTLTVTDANSCTLVKSFTISQPAAALSAVATQTNVACNGGNTGAAALSVNGGTTPYSYVWTPSGGSASKASNLVAGTYTVTVKDANSCTIAEVFTISHPTALSAVATQTNVACNGGNTGGITVSVNGGSVPYTYNWTPSGGTNSEASSLNAGTYTLTVKDANNCSITKTFTISQPAAPLSAVTAQTNVACKGGNGTATATVSGGTSPYTYEWAPAGGTTSTASVPAGSYTLTVKDANGCTLAKNFSITEPANALSVMMDHNNVLCNGGTGKATVTASGGTTPYTYNWAPSGGTASTATLPAGSYTVTVKDANNCTVKHDFTISQPTALTGVTSQVNLLCNGANTGEASITASGGVAPYSYTWTPSGGSTSTASGLTAGNYTVTVTDANSCSIQKIITITQPAPVQTFIWTTNPTCKGGNNGEIEIQSIYGGKAPYSYLWSPTGETGSIVPKATAGTYTLTITDDNDCKYTRTVTVNPALLGNDPTYSQKNITCNGGKDGSATINITSGNTPISYNWAPKGGTSPTANNLDAGTYTVTVTDGSGCQVIKTFTISQPDPILTNAIVTNAACTGGANGAITVNASNGTAPYKYLWKPSGNTTNAINNLAPGTYSLTITDNKSCAKDTVFTINKGSISANVNKQDILCNGGNNGAVMLTGTGGTAPYTYQWSSIGGTESSVSGLPAGTYTVTITDASSCVGTKTITIKEPAILVVKEAQKHITCFGMGDGVGAVSISGGTGPYTYSWWPSGETTSTISGLTVGNYSVTVTDANSCQAVQGISISEPGLLTASIATKNDTKCFGSADGSATVVPSGGTAPFTYKWAAVGGTGSVGTGLVAGVYTVTVTDVNKCSVKQTVTIDQPTKLVIGLDSVLNPICGQINGSISVTSNGGTPGYNYLWSNGASGSIATNLSAGNYTCTVTDVNNCKASVSKKLILISPVAVTYSYTGKDTVCDYASSFLLTGGTPSGGTYSGTGVENGYFVPFKAQGGWNVITYTYMDPNNCPGFASDSIYVSHCFPTTIDPTVINTITVYPNPFGQSFVIAGKQHGVITLYDVLGQLVMTQAINGIDTVIDTQDLQPGIYYLQMQRSDNASIGIQKLIKQ